MLAQKKNNEQNEEEPQCEGEEEPEVDPGRTHTPAGGIRVKDRPTHHGGNSQPRPTARSCSLFPRREARSRGCQRKPIARGFKRVVQRVVQLSVDMKLLLVVGGVFAVVNCAGPEHNGQQRL